MVNSDQPSKKKKTVAGNRIGKRQFLIPVKSIFVIGMEREDGLLIATSISIQHLIPLPCQSFVAEIKRFSVPHAA